MQKSAATASARAGFSLSGWLNNLNWAFKPALTFGLILLAASVGWLFYRQMIGENKPEFAQDNPTPIN
ncbi:MAG: hypothetical protein M3Q78_06605 [Acidobacteriota bacterium]|nr:hypothetical protein [Acidobacteriota bacterium]